MFYEQKFSSGNVLYVSKRGWVNARFPLHLHKSFELVFVMEGVLTVTIGTEKYQVKRGEAALIFPGQPHAYFTEKESYNKIVVFSPDYLEDLYDVFRGGKRHYPVFRFDEPEFPQALTGSREDRYMVRSLLYRVASAYAKGEACTDFSTRDEHLMYQIVSYVDEHFKEELTLKALSVQFGYNYQYMSGLIQTIYGCSFPCALHSKRIAFAQDLLLKREKSISEIAEACGYPSMRSFDRNFKKIEGCSPREYLAQIADTVK